MHNVTYSSAMLKVLKARENIARTSPYFASAVYTGKVIETKQFPTACTNGISVFFNPDFIEHVARKNKRHVEFVTLHEYLHKLLNHVGRCEWRKPDEWNLACDYSVNPIILDMGYEALEGIIYRADMRGMSPEKIYDILMSEKQDKKDQSGGDDSKGKRKILQHGSGAMIEPTEEELKEARNEAHRECAKLLAKPGNMPGSLQQALSEMFPTPIVDWKQAIEDLAKEANDNAEKSWSRPNRRYASTGMILPGENHGRIFRVIVCFDVSGSITANSSILQAMKAEIAELFNQRLITNATLISTDTRICNVAEASNADDVESFYLGNHIGGGTDFDAAMARVCHADEAVGCIFLTDMQTQSFGKEPDFPVIWVNWGRKGAVAPFGKTVDYN